MAKRHVTADQFVQQLREGECHGRIDRSIHGATYIHVDSVHGDHGKGITIVFVNDRFQRAFDVQPGIPRHRRRSYRSMAAVLRALGVHGVTQT